MFPPGLKVNYHRCYNQVSNGYDVRSLMMIELGTAAETAVAVLNYDGMPITADNIFRQIKGKM